MKLPRSRGSWKKFCSHTMTHARIASSYCACTGNAVHGSFLARKLDGRRQNRQTDDIYIYIIYVYYIHDNSSIFSLFLSPFSLPPPSLSLNVNRECEKIREDSIQIRYRLKYLYKELQKSLSLLLTYWSPHCCHLHAPVGSNCSSFTARFSVYPACRISF